MRLSLATRIFLGYAVVLVTFGSVSIFSVAEMHRNQQEIRLISRGYLHLAQDAAALETFHENRQRDTERVLEEKSPETRKALVRLSQLYFPPLVLGRIEQGQARVRELTPLAPASEAAFVADLQRRFDELEAGQRRYDAAADQLFRAVEERGPPGVDALAQLALLERGLGRELRFVRAALENRIRERVEAAERRERRSGIAIIGFSVLAIGVGLGATALSARTLRPLRLLAQALSRIRRGDFTAKLGLRGEDEVSMLAREFDAMAGALEEREALLRQKQQALLRAEQLAAVGRISAQVAHEVRNPLSSIGLNAELLDEALGQARFEGPEAAREARELLSAISREVDRLAEITEQYLRMARAPAPTLRPERLDAVVDEVLGFCREELERSHIRPLRSSADPEQRVLADAGQLRQVLLNLLRNSREAMTGGGELEVTTTADGPSAELRLRDSGPGMAPEIRDRVFDPFFSTKDGGTGLGLAVSRQILQAHGGSIDCESAPGGGTTFVIRLPRE